MARMQIIFGSKNVKINMETYARQSAAKLHIIANVLKVQRLDGNGSF